MHIKNIVSYLIKHLNEIIIVSFPTIAVSSKSWNEWVALKTFSWVAIISVLFGALKKELRRDVPKKSRNTHKNQKQQKKR